MRITSLKLHPYTAAREYGTVIAKAGGGRQETKARSEFFFLELATDQGIAGWGEVSDIDPEERPEPVEYGRLLADFMVGRDPFAVQQMHRDFREHFDSEEYGAARLTECGLDMAMYDIQGRATGQAAHRLLGGAMRPDVLISWVAFIREDLDLLREEMREKVAAGFRAFKIKVGADIDLDDERVAIAREVAGRDASIKVDANAGWSVRDAPANIRRLNRYHLAGVETPVPRENPADIAAVRKQVDVPILEHVSDLEYGLALLKADAVDVFNISAPGCGGLWPARQVATLTQAAGVGLLLGSTVEMGLGTLAQLQLAASVPNLTLPSDLVGPGLYRQHLLEEPLRYEKGRLKIPTAAGLGGQIDRAKLAAGAEKE